MHEMCVVDEVRKKATRACTHRDSCVSNCFVFICNGCYSMKSTEHLAVIWPINLILLQSARFNTRPK